MRKEIKKIEEILQEIKEKEEELRECIIETAGRLPEKEREQLERQLYWQYPEIEEYLLLDIFDKEETPRAFSAFGAYGLKTVCVKCGEAGEELVNNREELARLMDQIPVALMENNKEWPLCQKCQKIEDEALHKKMERWDWEYKDRIRYLKNLPYPEYLKTSEWLTKRAYMLKKAKNRCQLCNREDTVLNVHHKTYINLGEELDEDLIVLCLDCHLKVHGWEKRRKEDRGNRAKAGMVDPGSKITF